MHDVQYPSEKKHSQVGGRYRIMLPLPPGGLPDGWSMEQWGAYGHEFYQHNPHVLSEILEQNQAEKEAEKQKIPIKYSRLKKFYDYEKEEFEKKRKKRMKVIIALVVLLLLPIPISVINNILDVEDDPADDEWEQADDDMDGVPNHMDYCVDSSRQFEVDSSGCTKDQGGTPYSPIDLTVRSLNRNAEFNWWYDEIDYYKGFDEAEGDIKLSKITESGRVVILHFLPFEDIWWEEYEDYCKIRAEPYYSASRVDALEHIVTKSDEWNNTQGQYPIQTLTIITDYSTNSFEEVRSTFSNSCTDNESSSGYPDNIFFWAIAYGSANSVSVGGGGLTADLESELNVYSETLFVVDTQGYVVAREDYTDGNYNWNSFDTVVGNAVNGNTDNLRTNASRSGNCPYDKEFYRSSGNCYPVDYWPDPSSSGESVGASGSFLILGGIIVYSLFIIISILFISIIYPKLIVRSVIKKSRVAVDVGDLTRALAMLKAHIHIYEGNSKLSQEYKHLRELVEIDRSN
jgi:hypothetical protein